MSIHHLRERRAICKWSMWHWGMFMQPLLQWKSSKYYIIWVCICRLTYPARKVHVTLIPMACSALQYFNTLSHKRHDFRKKKLLNTKYVFWFSLQLLSETLFLLRVINRDMIKNVCWPSCNESIILVWFQWNLNFLRDFWKIFKYQISWKYIQWELSCPMYTDRQTWWSS